MSLRRWLCIVVVPISGSVVVTCVLVVRRCLLVVVTSPVQAQAEVGR